VASHLLDDEGVAACAVMEDPASAPISDKLRALLQIADKVQRSGKHVTEADIDLARAAGSGDEDIHDAVLVASTFCMLNRYVDGLAAVTPTDDETYAFIGALLGEQGYRGQLAGGAPPE
jgi:alkylhydroperoxidase family enzyme